MRTFTSQHQITEVKRLTYSGSPAKGTRAATGTTGTGYLRPLSEDQAAQNGMQWGQGFTLICEVGIDIQVGDMLTIDGGTYTVRGFADHNRGGATAYYKYLLVKGEA